jgi:ATP-dependent RNA helicase RhlE
MLKEIEKYLHNPISVLGISNSEYQATIDFSEDASHDWLSLIKDQEEFEVKKQLKKNKKKKKR